MGFFIVAGVLDHSVPLTVLMIEFSFNCIPFITRHFLITLCFGLVYAIFNITYTLKVDIIYGSVDYTKVYDYLFPIGGFVLCIVLFYCIVYFSKMKLRRSKKSVAL